MARLGQMYRRTAKPDGSRGTALAGMHVSLRSSSDFTVIPRSGTTVNVAAASATDLNRDPHAAGAHHRWTRYDL